MANEDLKPCPFCGEPPKVTERPDNIDGTRFFACVVCYCGGYSSTAHKMAIRNTPKQAKADATAAWNTRATLAKPEAQQPLGEAQLEAAYREIWRNKPAHFRFTTSDWITAGIRYAERAHGIGGIGASGEASNG